MVSDHKLSVGEGIIRYCGTEGGFSFFLSLISGMKCFVVWHLRICCAIQWDLPVSFSFGFVSDKGGAISLSLFAAQLKGP